MPSRLMRRVRSTVRASAPGRAGGVGRDGQVAALLASGVFDREFYEAQVGLTFESDAEAAAHYAAIGTGHYSPHPLWDLSRCSRRLVDRLQGDNGVSVLVDHLRTRGANRSLSPVFDARRLTYRERAYGSHPGGVLGLFLEREGADAPLPGTDGVTLADVRPAMLEYARQRAADRDQQGTRLREDWDEAAEQRWRARWEGAPLPDGDGPLVSVVMPVRNRPDVVRAAIDSVRAQTLDRWELVVVDDGSTDHTLEVLRGLAEEEPRLTVVAQPWGGVCAARNTGLEHARGDYVAFLDSDNTWRPDFLRLAVAAMHAQDLPAAYAGMRLTDPRTGETSYRAYEGGLADLLVVNHVDLNVLVVRRALALEVGGFDPALRRWVDHDFALRLAKVVDLTLLPFIAVDYDDSRESLERITTTESDAWQFVVLGQHWVDWDAVRAGVAERVAGRVSVVIPTWNDARMTLDAVTALARNTPGADLEVVVLDNGSRLDIGLSLTAGLVGTGTADLVRVERLPRNLNFAVGCNVGFARSTGATVVFLNNDTEVRPGWLDPLVAALDDPEVLGAQPLLLYGDDTVQAAGTAFPVEGALPVHFLARHPVEDVLRAGQRDFAVVTAAALAMRADDVAELRGFDPIYVNGMEDIDLCLRAAERRPGTFRVVTESLVTHHESKTPGRSTHIATNRVTFMQRWAGRLPAAEPERWTRAGFDIAHVHGDQASVPAPRLLLTRRPLDPGPDGRPTLRWGLRSPAPGGEVGDLWGDTHFLASLGAGLTALGQQVVTFRHDAHSDPVTAYDDVVLGIRGLDVIAPVPGKTNVLWVISHPDEVATWELMGFDLVYAASEAWARAMTARSGRRVDVLLQATDLARRADLSTPVGDGSHPVFVGGAPRQRVRPIVADALAAGVPLVVHGPHWQGKVPDAVRGREYVPNHLLMQTYRDHGLVLADHWADMTAAGFLANRLFDAVASGARVVSDAVPGLEIFEGAVQPYHSVEELALLCSPEGRDRFPDDEQMGEIADRVARDHSFDARAATLLDDVLRVRSERHTG
ncbi:glycosyltransferase [Nocardioides sp. SYSU D00038]|uniref:glycosyltransferase n=1 Tax=Nocardioides sp. SYSU D00038 TaxID=2812554 RepID=UPI00196792D3|nr:glycosyltransferase [Nocardioides sp. SYSU D00038]